MKEALQIVIKRLNLLAQEDQLCERFWLIALRLMENYTEGKDHAEEEIWKFLLDNSRYVFGKKLISFKELESWFTKSELRENNIFIDEEGVKLNNEKAVFYNSTGIIAGHSMVLLFGNSVAKAYDTSCVYCYDNSYLMAKDCMAFAFEKSKVVMKGYGKIEAFDNSVVEGTGYAYIISQDNAEVASQSPSVIVRQR